MMALTPSFRHASASTRESNAVLLQNCIVPLEAHTPVKPDPVLIRAPIPEVESPAAARQINFPCCSSAIAAPVARVA